MDAHPNSMRNSDNAPEPPILAEHSNATYDIPPVLLKC